ncbi:hypothetical protein [Streptomyces sp. NPDC057257]|uniref:hypothetical protein n=1 Tax=Streptomyces sp. NPDC057257 TaxID=3346071 RepID=UPI003644D6F9
MAKAREHFTDDGAGHERIRSIDDEVLFKVKVERWRGAVWTDEDLPWLIAAGQREDGSPDDFYSALKTTARVARAHYNASNRQALSTTTYVGHLLPGQNDRDRYRLEAGARLVRDLAAAVRELSRGSLHDGHETYAAVHITGSVPDDLVAVILHHVPGCDPAAWYPEYALPSRPLLPAEQAWSTLMARIPAPTPARADGWRT